MHGDLSLAHKILGTIYLLNRVDQVNASKRADSEVNPPPPISTYQNI